MPWVTPNFGMYLYISHSCTKSETRRQWSFSFKDTYLFSGKLSWTLPWVAMVVHPAIGVRKPVLVAVVLPWGQSWSFQTSASGSKSHLADRKIFVAFFVAFDQRTRPQTCRLAVKREDGTFTLATAQKLDDGCIRDVWMSFWIMERSSWHDIIS